MELLKMYGGDKARTPDLDPSTTAGEGETHLVTTAKECYDILMRCKEEGRFPGETVESRSYVSQDSVLLNVIHECASMDTYKVHRDRAGDWIMSGRSGYVVGFVHLANRDTGRNEQWVGLAYVGG